MMWVRRAGAEWGAGITWLQRAGAEKGHDHGPSVARNGLTCNGCCQRAGPPGVKGECGKPAR